MKNWKYIEGAKTGNEDLKSYSEVLEKAKRELEKVKEKEKMADSIKSKEEWASARREIEDKIKYYQSRIGNDDKTGAEEFFKKLSDDVKEREDKDDADIEKVGNLSKDELLKELDAEEKLLKVLKERGGEKGYGTTPILYRDAERRIQDLKNKLKQIGNKVGNSKWELPDGSTATVEDDGTIKIKKPRDSSIYITKLWDKERAEKQLAQKGAKKVGNAKDKNDKDLKIGDIVDVRGKKGKITKIIGDVIEVFYDNSGTYNPDRIDRHYADEATKIGNSKTGNATPNYRYKDFLITNPEGHEYIVFLKDGRTVGYRGTTSKAQAEDWCDWHDPKTGKSIGNKTGNSAQDDKFAYVMREFDEGKLKTPDGKVVTDPAQAKAIAYSESKKTENGLARSRKAMACNKKVKNSAVREYKHSDGRVAQIDFNEDGTDADMSIYEGTKEIEQKNFSTIRDAEQYVTSHGFRRI